MSYSLTKAFIKWSCAFLLLAIGGIAAATPYSLSYSGRITDQSGKPLSSSVTLRVEFFRSETGATSIPVTLADIAVTPANGVFQIAINLTPADFNTVFNGTDPVWIQIKDLTNSKVFPRQSFTAVPYALKVPIDEATLAYDVDGRLTLSAAPQDGKFLTSIGGELAWSTLSGGGDMATSTYDNSGTPGVVDNAEKLGGQAPSYYLDAANLTGTISDARIPSSIARDSELPVVDSTSVAAAGAVMDGDFSSNGLMLRLGAGSYSSVTAISGGSGGYLADDSVTNADIKSDANIAATKLGTGLIDNTEFNYLDGVSENIQQQLNNKMDLGGGSLSGAVTLPANGLVVGSNQLTVSGGNVGIGTSSPAAKLDVAGQVKISGGSPGAGKVLTSDESGLASWQPAASGGDLSYGSSALSPNDAVFVTDSGRVGIGTTAPEAKLQVTGDISTGSGAIRWKTYQGTTDPSGATTSFAHGLAAANVLTVNCAVRAAGGTYYNFGATSSGARFVTWSDANITINFEAVADWWSRPYRCIAQFVEAISDVDGFSAVTGTDDAGDILISVNFPGSVGMYDYVSIRRLASANPPNADCTSDGTVVHTFNTFSDASIKDSYATGGLVGGNFYSYRLCIFGTDGSMTSFATASNVQAKLPANVDGFSAVTGSINLGDINVSVDFSADVSDYDRVEIRRKVGATPPLASCDDGSDHVRTFSTYADASYTDQLDASTYYSYRVCVFGNDGSLVSSTTVANVLTFSNYTTFITSTSYNGNLGGVAGADQKCQERATAAGLPNPGSYRAIISTSTQSAYDRLVINGPIYNTLGALVAANKADFWDSQWAANDLMRKTESGNNFLDYVWTGIQGGNGGIASNNCSNWTSTSGSGQIGWPDRKASNGDDVFDISSRSCSATQPLYCLSNQ